MSLASTSSALSSPTSRAGIDFTAGAAETAAHKKLRKAAEEFEGILISQLLGDFQSGFSSLTGDAPMAGSDSLNSLAIQTFSNALAVRGGLGIARMIVHQLEPSLNRSQQKPQDRRENHPHCHSAEPQATKNPALR